MLLSARVRGLFFLLFAASALAATRPQFEVIPLSNGPAAIFAYPVTLRLNNSNQITGAILTEDPVPHFESFLWQDGNVQALGEGRVEDLNDFGVWVGSVTGAVFQSSAPSLTPHAVNNAGQVV